MNLSCESVTKKIRNSTVIDNISFQWNGSNVYGLCGSNGSGKTMLLRIISGLIFPTSGCIKINGKILGKDLEFPPSMGMLLENPSFLMELYFAGDSRKTSGHAEYQQQAQTENPFHPAAVPLYFSISVWKKS